MEKGEENDTGLVESELAQVEQSPTVQEEGSKFMLSPRQMLSERQVLYLLQKTPQSHIYTRQGRGGSQVEYVTGVYVKKVLNYAFGWLWNFEIESEQVIGDQIVVRGRLTVTLPDRDDPTNSVHIVKTQYGRADIKYMKGSDKTVNIGDDFKAAATDALKKCASELGIASDVYGRGEFKEIKIASTSAADSEPAPQEMLEEILGLLAEKEIELDKLLSKIGKGSLSELTKPQAEKLIAQLIAS